ncbi:hypothetical protein [Flavobacterium sp. Arc2]|uniref:hypothetical protein n=1 Tax=Flavobacterium sp. Arc2 TaxID=3046685 RepID=UPI00352D4182
MNIDEHFGFGQYKNLTLLEVYSGTEKINSTLLKKYLKKSLNDTNVPKSKEFEFIDELVITEDEIIIFPDNTFDEHKTAGADNLFYLGNISQQLEIYFNKFFEIKWIGIAETLEKFNQVHVIGANPEYIEWCITKGYIKITQDTKNELEKKKINRLLGIKVTEIKTNKYSYKPIIKTKYYKFKT